MTTYNNKIAIQTVPVINKIKINVQYSKIKIIKSI